MLDGQVKVEPLVQHGDEPLQSRFDANKGSLGTAPPVLALMGLQFGYLLGGSILVETVFNWPGSGNLLNLAIFRRDIPVLQATIVVLSTFFVLLNLAVDIAQAAIDPRIRR